MFKAKLTLLTTPEPEPEAQGIVRAEQPARALIGWMSPENAHRILASNQIGAVATVHQVELAQRARDRVAAREPGLDQTAIITARPPELDAHMDALRASPSAQPMFDEGWDVAMVDLTRVCAFQPIVLSEQAVERVRGIDLDDLFSIAAVTLPVAPQSELPLQFDAVRQAWVVTSPNPNLRIAGPVGPFALQPGAPPVLGFGVSLGTSFLQVGCLRGRHYLRDGYHRAFGLLSRGITMVPAFVRNITAFEELLPDPRTMLPQESYQGQRPPVLLDYLDDDVSAGVQVSVPQKMIVVQGLELAPIM